MLLEIYKTISKRVFGTITAQGRERLSFGSWGPIEETSSFMIKVRERFGSLVDLLEGAHITGLTSNYDHFVKAFQATKMPTKS